MHKSYVIKKESLARDLFHYDSYSDEKISYAKKSDDVLIEIKDYIESNEEIDAKKIMGLMFPADTPHLFISHKSQNANQAIRLANILHSEYKIKSFIDSQVWQHIDVIGKMINDKTSIMEVRDSKTIYNYKSADIVASNMFSMLSVALLETMDSSDGYLYIDSNDYDNNKISSDNINQLITKSPWLFLEARYASMLRSKKQKRPKITNDSYPMNESAGIEELRKSGTSFSYEFPIGEAVHLDSLYNAFDFKGRADHPLKYLDLIYNNLDSNSRR